VLYFHNYNTLASIETSCRNLWTTLFQAQKSKGGEMWNNYQSSWHTLWRICETLDITGSDGAVFVINVEVNKSHGYNWPEGQLLHEAMMLLVPSIDEIA